MLVLALDQASKITGYSIWNNNQLIKYGKFTFNQNSATKRLTALGDKVKKIITTLNIDELVIENIQLETQVGNNAATFQILAQLQGILIYVAHECNIPITLLRPTEWRSICGLLKGQSNKRQEQKRFAQQWVYNKWGKTCTEDEADAICIGYAYCNKTENELNWE